MGTPALDPEPWSVRTAEVAGDIPHSSLEAPRGDRRLFVLNVCSGGVSATHGGPLGFGIAPFLAGASQTLVSHLWPTAPAVAAAFGTLLAIELRRGADHLAAFGSAAKALQQGRSVIVEALRSAPGDGPRLADHLERSSHDLDAIVHWALRPFISSRFALPRARRRKQPHVTPYVRCFQQRLQRSWVAGCRSVPSPLVLCWPPCA